MEPSQIYESLNRAYFSEDCHEKEVLSHLGELLGGALTFVDIGASLGQYTYHASRLMTGGRILAIEADPLRHAELARKCCEWRAETGNEVNARNLALCDREGTIPFYVSNTTMSGGLFARPNGPPEGWTEVSVPAGTLDALFPDEPPDVVKIDVEGSEYRVLKGAKGILAKGRTKFLIELHGPGFEDPALAATPAEFADFLASFGYARKNFHGRALFVRG